MSNFRQTSEALIEWQANTESTLGNHIDPNVAVGVHSNIVIGEIPFDVTHHNPYDIDHMSLMGAATGDLYVSEVLPERPFSAHLIVDGTTNREHPVVTRGKARLARSLGMAIEYALPGISDHVETHRLVSERSFSPRNRQGEIMVVPGEQGASEKAIQELAYGGLTFVITDGRRLQLPEGSLQRCPVIAVKINHMLERELTADSGVLPVWDYKTGEMKEIDTSNPRKLKKQNAELEEEHQAIVERLRRAGMSVAEVITTNSLQRFDIAQADKSIAKAVRMLGR